MVSSLIAIHALSLSLDSLWKISYLVEKHTLDIRAIEWITVAKHSHSQNKVKYSCRNHSRHIYRSKINTWKFHLHLHLHFCRNFACFSQSSTVYAESNFTKLFLVEVISEFPKSILMHELVTVTFVPFDALNNYCEIFYSGKLKCRFENRAWSNMNYFINFSTIECKRSVRWPIECC